MITRREIVDDLVPFPLQGVCRDYLDGKAEIQDFQAAFAKHLGDYYRAGYTHPGAAAYLMEYGFSKIDQGQREVEARLEEALSVVIKAARSKGVLGMMMDMRVKGMQGMPESMLLREYSARNGFNPLADVSVLESDHPQRLPWQDGNNPGTMKSWQQAMSEKVDSLLQDLLAEKLTLADFKQRATNTTGDTPDGYADVLLLTMSRGFEYFAHHVGQGSADLPKKLGILKAAVSSIISAADTDAKQKAAVDDIVKNGLPEGINDAAYDAGITLSVEAAYEGARRPEMLKAVLVHRTAMPLYGKETNQPVTPVEYAGKIAGDASAGLAQVARDILTLLKQHDLGR